MSLYKILLFFLLIINLHFQEYEIDSLIENKHYIAAEKAIINSIQQNENDESREVDQIKAHLGQVAGACLFLGCKMEDIFGHFYQDLKCSQ